MPMNLKMLLQLRYLDITLTYLLGALKMLSNATSNQFTALNIHGIGDIPGSSYDNK